MINMSFIYIFHYVTVCRTGSLISWCSQIKSVEYEYNSFPVRSSSKFTLPKLHTVNSDRSRPNTLLPPPWRRLCFHRCSLVFLFVCLSVCLSFSNITEKRTNGFSWNFQQKWVMRQATIWNVLGMCQLTPWIQDWFFCLLDPCLLVMLWKNGWTDFH